MQSRPQLEAEAVVTLDEALPTIGRVFDHFAEHDARTARIENGARAEFFFGEASMQALPTGVVMRARAADESALATVKTVLASHLLEYAVGRRPEIVWTGDGVDATTFPNFREMRVARIVDLTPHMRRITLSGRDLERFETHGLHFKLLIPPDDGGTPEWPVPGRDGLPVWPSDEKRPKVRTYTVRRVDLASNSFDVDFVVHGDHSVGSRWAMNARPGDVVGVRGPIGRPVPAAEWYLLVGDETALPMIARILEALPTEAKGVALIEVADPGEEVLLTHPAGVELRWLHRDGAAAGTTTLLIDAVRQIRMPPPSTRMTAMAGVEFTAFRALRDYWRDEIKLDKKDMLVVTYWRRGRAEDDPNRNTEA